MGSEKFTWVIKNLSSLQSNKGIYSDEFVIGGCKWCLMTFPQGILTHNYLSLYLKVAGFETLPRGWKRHARFSLTVVNQISDKLSQRRETERCFDQKFPVRGILDVISLTELVNDEVKIVVEIEVLQVIGKLDVSQELNQPLKRIRLNGDGGGAVSSHSSSSVDVNGFQVLPSQAESVKRIFEKHPDMALEFRAKNQDLRTSCINVLLSLIKTLCQSLQDLSIDDLGQAEQALTYLIHSGFKVDWLERKLEEVKVKKIEEQFGKTRMQQLEEELKVSRQKCSDMESLLEKEKEELKVSKQMCSDIEALLEKEKTKVLAAARAPPLTLDDVV
ncbi:PREDICTED: MATH domain and coiled-coil domain-containing protein At3g44790 [Camelina sativa]|uniref:MATH domain and coiled-coil domain-containing protein At3g44790 n=1 Tax=Camelina sativa TaxID=90675 RepID=A0ABM1RTA9_CAMSA|nr:PREDICTED: MATH domain and coiled-coil domain-containing protein At3g44790 [Camelina sativa]